MFLILLCGIPGELARVSFKMCATLLKTCNQDSTRVVVCVTDCIDPWAHTNSTMKTQIETKNKIVELSKFENKVVRIGLNLLMTIDDLYIFMFQVV